LRRTGKWGRQQYFSRTEQRLKFALFEIIPKEWRYVMSCYFRHIKDVLDEAGVAVTTENKKDIDRIIHDLVDVEYKNCSNTWKAVKRQIKGDDRARSQFIKRLKKELMV
jgi:hypothetical protein